jgi:hypothetical protein
MYRIPIYLNVRYYLHDCGKNGYEGTKKRKNKEKQKQQNGTTKNLCGHMKKIIFNKTFQDSTNDQEQIE